MLEHRLENPRLDPALQNNKYFNNRTTIKIFLFNIPLSKKKYLSFNKVRGSQNQQK
jgi:hypothetical protein